MVNGIAVTRQSVPAARKWRDLTKECPWLLSVLPSARMGWTSPRVPNARIVILITPLFYSLLQNQRTDISQKWYSWLIASFNFKPECASVNSKTKFEGLCLLD